MLILCKQFKLTDAAGDNEFVWLSIKLADIIYLYLNVISGVEIESVLCSLWLNMQTVSSTNHSSRLFYNGRNPISLQLILILYCHYDGWVLHRRDRFCTVRSSWWSIDRNSKYKLILLISRLTDRYLLLLSCIKNSDRQVDRKSKSMPRLEIRSDVRSAHH